MRPPGPRLTRPFFANCTERPRTEGQREAVRRWRRLPHKRDRREAKKQINDEMGGTMTINEEHDLRTAIRDLQAEVKRLAALLDAAHPACDHARGGYIGSVGGTWWCRECGGTLTPEQVLDLKLELERLLRWDGTKWAMRPP